MKIDLTTVAKPVVTRAVCHLRSLTPYAQGSRISEPKRDKESADAHEKRCWKQRCHTTGDGRVYIPGTVFAECMKDTAQFLGMQIKGKGKQTYTKHFRCGIQADPITLPLHIDDVQGRWLYVPSDGKKGSGSRVDKCFPTISDWEGEVTFMIVDATITSSVFAEHLVTAGLLVGIGSWRPIHGGDNGRFEVLSIDWQENVTL